MKIGDRVKYYNAIGTIIKIDDYQHIVEWDEEGQNRFSLAFYFKSELTVIFDPNDILKDLCSK